MTFRRISKGLLFFLAVVCALWLVWQNRQDWLGVDLYRVESVSMLPTLQPDDIVLVRLNAYQHTEPSKNDIVVLHDPPGEDLDEEAIQALKDQIDDIVMDNMGVVGDVMGAVDEYTPDWYRDLEEEVQDKIAGLVGDEAREMLANWELPDVLQEYVCEVYEE